MSARDANLAGPSQAAMISIAITSDLPAFLSTRILKRTVLPNFKTGPVSATSSGEAQTPELCSCVALVVAVVAVVVVVLVVVGVVV